MPDNKYCYPESEIPELEDGFSLQLKDGKYYISDGKETKYLCKNTPEQAVYIKDIANTYIENRKIEERMETWQMWL